MSRYEILMLAVPTVTQDEAKSIESGLDRICKEGEGTIISFEKWGKYRLAYPIKKNDYGVYFLARFEAENPGKLLKEVRPLLKVKLHEIVMRYVVTALDAEKSLAYQRPQSLEEEPTRDRDDALSKGKIERILSTSKPDRQEEPKVEKKTDVAAEEVEQVPAES